MATRLRKVSWITWNSHPRDCKSYARSFFIKQQRLPQTSTLQAQDVRCSKKEAKFTSKQMKLVFI